MPDYDWLVRWDRQMAAIEPDAFAAMRDSLNGADPVTAERLYDYFVAACGQAGLPTQTGRFAADMQVFLQNDGPVTFWLEV